jgi:hypothetical protein
MRPRLFAALAFLAAGAVVLAHGNNPPQYMGDWFGHSDAAYWADRETGITSPEAIAVGHVVAAILIALPRVGLWLLAGVYAAVGAWLWITLIGANVAEVALGETAVVDLVVPGGMVVAYIAIVVVLYRALRSPGSDIRVGSASPAEARR